MTVKLLFLLITLLLAGCGFRGPVKTVETRRGRLKYLQTMEYRTGGLHGSEDWYGLDKKFQFNDKDFSPDVTFDGCTPSPNESVEAFNCFKIHDFTETAFILRIKDNKPVTEKFFEEDSRDNSGADLGEWVDTGGKWLILRNFFYHIETGEKRPIKWLPDVLSKYYRAAAPDLETIVYQGTCFYIIPETDAEIKKTLEKVCSNSDNYDQKKIEILWLIDSKTGAIKFVELSREKYDWLIWDREKFETYNDWLQQYQSHLVWEKDKNDKFWLAAPK